MFNNNSNIFLKLYVKKIMGDFLMQYKKIYNNHIYWNFKKIRNGMDIKTHPAIPFNVSALSGSTIEDIRKETAINI